MSSIFFRTLFLGLVVTAINKPLTGFDAEEKIQLKITGGDETDPRDRGRPVALVAGGLGVEPQVFRDAFSGVRPASGGREPEPEQVRKNKAVLMAALGKYNVTNDDLDRVSNFYRYPPGGKKSWPMKAAGGYALIKDGEVASVVITERGYGYNSPPTVTIPGYAALALEARLTFDSDLHKNGSIASIVPVSAGHEKPSEFGHVLPPAARANLKLTAAQEKEIAELEDETRARLAKILTADQQKKLVPPVKQSQGPRGK